MKEMDLRSKAHVVPVAVVAGLGMAGMGLVSDRVVVADTASVTDSINVMVQPSCTFNSVEDKTYVGSAANGTEVNNFNDGGVHAFNLFCNDNNGFVVSATAYDLEADGITDVIAYTDNYTHTGVNSMWTAEIASEAPGVTVVQTVPAGGGTIVSSDSSTSATGVDFTATYSAYVGSGTPAGTYTGTIVYTLTASGTSSGGTSNSGNGGQNDNSGQNENGGENGENGGEGGSGTGGTGGSGTGDANSGGSGNTPSNTPSNTTSNTPSAAPLALNNTYNTYSTTNTYNTTNYSGGSGVSVPTANTQSVTSGVTSEDEENIANNDDNDGSEASDSYEQPLGVTTTTSLSNEDSGIDPMPLVVTASALAVAGVAAIAVAQNKKKEEN